MKDQRKVNHTESYGDHPFLEKWIQEKMVKLRGKKIKITAAFSCGLQLPKDALKHGFPCYLSVCGLNAEVTSTPFEKIIESCRQPLQNITKIMH